MSGNRGVSVSRDDIDHEGSRVGYRATGCSRFLFLELGCGQIHFMHLWVNVHCSGADWSGHCLLDLDFAWRGLARNFKLAVSATRKRPMTVELRSIHAGTDRRGGGRLPVVRDFYN